MSKWWSWNGHFVNIPDTITSVMVYPCHRWQQTCSEFLLQSRSLSTKCDLSNKTYRICQKIGYTMAATSDAISPYPSWIYPVFDGVFSFTFCD